MTTPVAHGFPDWGRQIAAADIGIFTLNAFAQGALSVGRGTYFVGNVSYVWIRQTVDIGGLRTRLNFVDAPSGGNFVSTHAIDVLAGMACTGPIPVTGPYMQVFTDVDVIGRLITVRLWQNQQGGVDFPGNIHNGMITLDALNVNAGATQVVSAPAVHWGWGYFNASIEAAALGNIRLLAIDYLGATQLLAYWVNGGPPMATVLVLPPRPVRIEALNGDAAPHPLYASLYFHPNPF